MADIWTLGYRQRQANKLWDEQRGRCWICGCEMWRIEPSRKYRTGRWDVTVDHIGEPNGQPREVRGAHRWCNGARGHMMPDEEPFAEQVKSVQLLFLQPSFRASMELGRDNAPAGMQLRRRKKRATERALQRALEAALEPPTLTPYLRFLKCRLAYRHNPLLGCPIKPYRWFRLERLPTHRVIHRAESALRAS